VPVAELATRQDGVVLLFYGSLHSGHAQYKGPRTANHESVPNPFPRPRPSTSVLCRIEPILYPQSYCSLAPSRIHSLLDEEASLTGSERRTTQRFSMRLPLTVRWTTGAAVGETSTESRDVSSRGVYFFLSKDVKEGSPVEILLTLPNEITLAGPVRVRCLGRVQRTEPREEGAVGVVAAIERYEFLRSEEDK
jgi:PilZ domain-containing protein